VRERDRVCRYCGSNWRLSVHHVTPYWLGGSDTLDNLRLACGVCHPKLDAAIRRRVRNGR
jgi:5-methylcytosine-specific restriction endonuclease McrA